MCRITSKSAIWILTLGFLLLPCPGAAKHNIVVWEHLWDDRGCLELILDHTVQDFGPYELVKSEKMEQGRAVYELATNDGTGSGIDLLWLPCSREREETLLPVYIYMGGQALGHRVCLIRKGDQYKFNYISSLKDWIDSGMTMGTGAHWADTEILEFNEIPVLKNVTYELLYQQLAAGRFDAFPRGIDQIMTNLNKYGRSLNITIEERLLFVYPFREIIFVSRHNPELKNRIETGFQRALKDGSWQECMFKWTRKKRQYDGLNLKDRIVIPLENPFLSKEARALPTFSPDPLE